MSTENKRNVECWYALRITYGRALKFKAILDEAGFSTFVPMCRKTVEKDGKKEKITVPAVTNLCFVRSTQNLLYRFMKDRGDGCPATFMWDKSSRMPIVVPDKPMEDFMKISLSMSDDILYLKDINEKLREGQKVMVLEGPFAGIEGTVIRVKRSRRVMVELPGMLAIATTYIPAEGLKIL